MSSKTITKDRPVRIAGAWLEEIRGREGVTPEGASGTTIDSKLAIFCGLLSSRIWKSAAVSPVMGTPFLSVTTTSTVTCSTSAGNRGASASAGGTGEGLGAGVWAASPATQRKRNAERRIGLAVIVVARRPRSANPIVRRMRPSADLDEDLPVLDLDRVGRDLQLGIGGVLSRGHVPAPCMPGTEDDGAVEGALAERAAAVDAGVARRVEGARDVVEGHRLAADADLHALAGGHFGGGQRAHEFGHRALLRLRV